MDQFDFDFQPSIDRKVIHGLAFVERAENVGHLDPPRVGKTRIAIARAVKATEAGHSVPFLTLERLITRLKHAGNENRLERQLNQFTYPKLLVPDGIGYRPMSWKEANLLLRMITRRYEKANPIPTSN